MAGSLSRLQQFRTTSLSYNVATPSSHLAACRRPLRMNRHRNASGGHYPAIADWLQLLASPKLAGGIPPRSAGMPPLDLSGPRYH
jgi:hypothetical protein